MFIKVDTTFSVGDRVTNKFFEGQGDSRVQKERYGIVTAVNLRAKVKQLDVVYEVLVEDGREYKVEEHDLKKFIQ